MRNSPVSEPRPRPKQGSKSNNSSVRIIGEAFKVRFIDADGRRMRGLKVESYRHDRAQQLAEATVKTLAENGVEGVMFTIYGVYVR